MFGLFWSENATLEDNPKDVNASIGGDAVFRCSFKNVSNCRATSVHWFINGTNVHEYTQELETYLHPSLCEVMDRRVSVITLRFSKSSDAQWNNSLMVCNGLYHLGVTFNIFSDPALLRIQGIYIYIL